MPVCQSLIQTTDKPTIEELEAGTTQFSKDYLDENSLVIPLSTITAAVPKFCLTVLRNLVLKQRRAQGATEVSVGSVGKSES